MVTNANRAKVPVILTEYPAGAATRKWPTTWDVIWPTDAIVGAFIWEWQAQGMYDKFPNAGRSTAPAPGPRTARPATAPMAAAAPSPIARQVGWQSRLFDRRYCDHTAPATLGDEKMLQDADRAWRELVAAQPDPEPNPALADQLDRIVAAARAELLAP